MNWVGTVSPWISRSTFPYFLRTALLGQRQSRTIAGRLRGERQVTALRRPHFVGLQERRDGLSDWCEIDVGGD